MGSISFVADRSLSLSLSLSLPPTRKELYKEESDSRWLLTFQEHLDIIEKSKRGFVLQIQQGVIREKSYMQISEEKMGKKWQVPRIGLYAFPVTAIRGGGTGCEEKLALAVEKARAQWEEGIKDEVQMVSEWFEPIGGDLELPVNGEGLVQGRVRCRWPSGEVYEGDWKDGKRNGNGTYTFADGGVFVGEYKDSKKNGKGTFTYADGAVFVGEYKDGKRNGKGTFTYPNGAVEVGFYEQDEDKGRGRGSAQITTRPGSSCMAKSSARSPSPRLGRFAPKSAQCVTAAPAAGSEGGRGARPAAPSVLGLPFLCDCPWSPPPFRTLSRGQPRTPPRKRADPSEGSEHEVLPRGSVALKGPWTSKALLASHAAVASKSLASRLQDMSRKSRACASSRGCCDARGQCVQRGNLRDSGVEAAGVYGFGDFGVGSLELQMFRTWGLQSVKM